MHPRPAATATRRSATSRRAVAVLVVLVALVALVAGWSFSPSAVSAHAMLASTDPVDGAELSNAPAAVTLTFNEPVEVPTGALRVFDADAQRVDVGPLETGDAAVVAAALPEDLPDGGYVITYRVLSGDAHPIGGVSAFTVGGGLAVDDATIGTLAGDAGAGLARPLGMALRGIGYLVTLLAGGAGLFAATVARRPRDRAAARSWALPAALAGVVVALLGVPVQAAALTGDGFGAAFSPVTVGEVLGSSFGTGTLVRAAALASLVVLWRPRTPAVVPVVVGFVAVGSFVLDGHQRSVDPTWLLVGGDLIHLAAAASWFGGLVVLADTLRRRSLDDDAIEAAGLVARFSTVALASFGSVAVGGVAMAIPLVGRVGALTTSTYGWLLVAKIAAGAVLVLMASYNRQRLVPAITALRVPTGGSIDTPTLDGDRRARRARAAWGRLRRTVRLEATVIAAVLMVTGVLVATQPASEAAGLGGLYETSAPLGEGLEIDIVVDPNEVGRNAIHLYVLDGTGRPAVGVEDVMLELTYLPEGIGPIPIEPFSAGPGHWVANSDELVFAGDWQVRIVGGVDRFTELSAEVTVPVAP